MSGGAGENFHLTEDVDSESLENCYGSGRQS